MSDSDNTQDSAAMSPASTGSVADGSLAAYLKWRDEKIASGDSDVNPFMVWSAGVRYATLTDAEREAVEAAIKSLLDDPYDGAPISPHAATLRGLLERTKGGER